MHVGYIYLSTSYDEHKHALALYRTEMDLAAVQGALSEEEAARAAEQAAHRDALGSANTATAELEVLHLVVLQRKGWDCPLLRANKLVTCSIDVSLAKKKPMFVSR